MGGLEWMERGVVHWGSIAEPGCFCAVICGVVSLMDLLHFRPYYTALYYYFLGVFQYFRRYLCDIPNAASVFWDFNFRLYQRLLGVLRHFDRGLRFDFCKWLFCFDLRSVQQLRFPNLAYYAGLLGYEV